MIELPAALHWIEGSSTPITNRTTNTKRYDAGMATEPFTSLADESAAWIAHLPGEWERAGRPFETRLLDLALESLERLRGTQGGQLLLHQDLHADNVLRAVWRQRDGCQRRERTAIH